MDRKKLESEIENWAASLGFCLPNNAAPPPNFFSSLTVTPHRRQLWEVLVETVHRRQKVEMIRKQLLVFHLKSSNRMNWDPNSKQFMGRMKLAEKQNAMEKEINEERQATIELERKILSKSSDLIFEMCKLAELDKQCQEYKEKSVALMLIKRKFESYAEELGKMLGNVEKNKEIQRSAKREELTQDRLSTIEVSMTWCNFKAHRSDDCDSRKKIKELLESGETESGLWDKLVVWKKDQLKNLSNLLNELDSTYRPRFLDKEDEIEKNLDSAISQLKQEIIIKSLQVMVVEAESRTLNLEIQNLMERAEGTIFKPLNERSLNDDVSYLTQEEIDSFSGKGESLVQLRNHVTCSSLKSYQDYLRAELSRYENLKLQREQEIKEDRKGRQKLEESMKIIDSISGEINHLRSEQEEQKREIIRLGSRLKELLTDIVHLTNDKNFVAGVQETCEQLKVHSEKQIALFMDLPLDALRTVEEITGKRIFACESLTHCFDNYGGEFKRFFQSMLIQPHQSVAAILKEIEKRQKVADSIKKFLSEREKIVEMEKNIFKRLTSIAYNSEACEKVAKDCERILSNIACKANDRKLDVEFLQKLMNNWLEQPYRLMINDTVTVAGVTLREYEEMYKKIGNTKIENS